MIGSAITIMSPGILETKIAADEIATFDLRLNGYTLDQMLDTTRPLPAPKYATLRVAYKSGTIREWYFSKDGYSAEYERPGDGSTPTLKLTSQTINTMELGKLASVDGVIP